MTAQADLRSAKGTQERAAIPTANRPLATSRFHWIVALLATWFVTGTYLDAWAHGNVAQLESFFTPWHAVLYSGALAVLAFVTAAQVRNNQQGYSVRRSLPEGYGWTLVGLIGFALGGVGDLLWHLAFGIEKDLEAVLSPTHLFLYLMGLLIVSGPMRAGWRRAPDDPPRGLEEWGPILLSLALTLLFMMTFPQVIHPLTEVAAGRHYPAGEAGQLMGALGVMVNTALLMGLLLFAVRRWRLPFGAFTFVFAVYAVGLTAMHAEYRFIPGLVLTGLVADVLNVWCKPSGERAGEYQLFGFAVPFVFHLFYFGTIALTEGISWTIHLWLGMTVIAGVIGLGLARLALDRPSLESQS